MHSGMQNIYKLRAEAILVNRSNVNPLPEEDNKAKISISPGVSATSRLRASEKTTEFKTFLQKFEQNMGSISYKESPFVEYKRNNLASFKAILIDLIHAYIDIHFQLTIEKKEQILEFINKIKSTTQYAAIYAHLSVAITTFKSEGNLSNLLSYVKNFPAFISDTNFNYRKTPQIENEIPAAICFNTIESAQFETDLACALLFESPKDSLKKINQAIILYCQKHKNALLETKENILKSELIKYHVCEKEDFEKEDAVEIFIKLLEQPLDPKCIPEIITLHLIFFNYNHIYEPQLEENINLKITDINADRKKLHEQIRPKNPGGMFDPKTRGRQKIYSKHTTTEFGITHPHYLQNWAQDWHKKARTPYKYRSLCASQSETKIH